MRQETINGHKVKFYDSIDDLPVERFQEFNKYLLFDIGIGNTFADVDRHILRLFDYISKEPQKARQELENMRDNMYFIIQKINPRHMAFACLISEIDGKPYTDLTDEGVRETIKLFAEANNKWFSGFIEAVKKKIEEELETNFPEGRDVASQNEYTKKMMQRNDILLDALIKDKDLDKAIEQATEIEYEIMATNPPMTFEGSNSVEVKYKKGCTAINLEVSKWLEGIEAKGLTVMQYYTAIDRMKAEQKELAKLKNKRR